MNFMEDNEKALEAIKAERERKLEHSNRLLKLAYGRVIQKPKAGLFGARRCPDCDAPLDGEDLSFFFRDHRSRRAHYTCPRCPYEWAERDSKWDDLYPSVPKGD